MSTQDVASKLLTELLNHTNSEFCKIVIYLTSNSIFISYRFVSKRSVSLNESSKISILKPHSRMFHCRSLLVHYFHIFLQKEY